MQNPPKGPDQRSVNQDFGPSNPYPVYGPTTHNMNQNYSQEAMVNMAYAPVPTDVTVNQVGQSSINHVYGDFSTTNKVDGQVSGQAPPVSGQAPPVSGQAPPVYGQLPPVYCQAPPIYDPFMCNRSTEDSTFISVPETIVNHEASDADIKTYDFSDSTIRRGFIRKVYSLVLLQLSITAGVASLMKYHIGTRMFVMDNLAIILMVALGTYITTAICIHCCEGPRRRVPYNYIFLMLFTLALALMLGGATMQIDDRVLVTAFGITMLIVVSLTIFAFQTKYDFTMLGGFLISFFLCIIITGLLAIFTYSEPLHLLYCGLGILFFSFLLVYDTQLIIGGEHRYTISPEEYVFAALCIYLDIVNIFIRVLRMVR